MLKYTCTVNFPDGANLSAKIEAATPGRDYPIAWSGAVERLAASFENAEVCFLQLRLKKLAEDSGGKFSETFRGGYDRW